MFAWFLCLRLFNIYGKLRGTSHTSKRPEMITNEFEAAGINEAFVNARTYVTRFENSFSSEVGVRSMW